MSKISTKALYLQALGTRPSLKDNETDARIDVQKGSEEQTHGSSPGLPRSPPMFLILENGYDGATPQGYCEG